MNSFTSPKPGDSVIYVCTKCNKRFSHKIPKLILGLIKKQVTCPDCGGIGVKDNSIKY